MGLQQAKLESLPFVTGELNYLAPTPGKPRTYAFDPPPGEPLCATRIFPVLHLRERQFCYFQCGLVGEGRPAKIK